MSHSGLKMDTGPKIHKFSGGETQIEFSKLAVDSYWGLKANVTIDARSYNNDLMGIAQAVDIFRHKKLDKINLRIPYMPYGRQDRRMGSNGYVGSHALKMFANFINSLEFDEVITFDPHSDVTEALFNNITIINNHGLVIDALSQLHDVEKKNDTHIVVPDTGASKKIIPLIQSLPWNMKQNPHIHQCEKHRNPTNGEITHTSIPSSLVNLPEKTKVCLIDDICDGGRSFIEIAKLAPHLNWNLVVSHGIFSKGLDPLFEHFDQIFTTRSFKQESHPNLIVLDF